MQPWDPRKLLCKEGPVATAPIRWGWPEPKQAFSLASLLPLKPRDTRTDLSSTQSLACLLPPPSSEVLARSAGGCRQGKEGQYRAVQVEIETEVRAPGAETMGRRQGRG